MKVLAAVAIVLATVTVAGATTYTGTLSGSALVGSGGWPSGASLEYWVSDTVEQGYWAYAYTLRVPNCQGGGISHLDVECSPSFTAANIEGGYGGACTIDWYGDQGDSSPGIPSVFHCMKWDASGQVCNVGITCDRAPIWGDFYAKGGAYNNPTFNAIWNKGFGATDTDPVFNPNTWASVTDHIIVPDTFSPPNGTIPEPLTMAATVAAVGGLGGYLRRRNR
jgi:hypothetical protein